VTEFYVTVSNFIFREESIVYALKVKVKSIFPFPFFKIATYSFSKFFCNLEVSMESKTFFFSLASSNVDQVITASFMAAPLVITVENRKGHKKHPKPQSQIARAHRAGAVASVPPSCRPRGRQTRRRPHARGGCLAAAVGSGPGKPRHASSNQWIRLQAGSRRSSAVLWSTCTPPTPSIPSTHPLPTSSP
jgi:hypothetical protein